MHRRSAIMLIGAAIALAPSLSDAQDNLRELRDEAIRNIGWVAGNAYGHPVWPQVKPYVGEGGEYYETFLRLAPRGSDPETEAHHNVALYREWFEKGQKHPFNEPEAVSRIKRVQQIANELGNTME